MRYKDDDGSVLIRVAGSRLYGRIGHAGFHVRDDVRAWMTVLASRFLLSRSWDLIIRGINVLPFQTDRPSRARVGSIVVEAVRCLDFAKVEDGPGVISAVDLCQPSSSPPSVYRGSYTTFQDLDTKKIKYIDNIGGK